MKEPFGYQIVHNQETKLKGKLTKKQKETTDWG